MTRHAAVVDTMVFAYYLLGVEQHREYAAAAFERLDEVWVPDSLRAELVNVVWQWSRKGGVSPDIASSALSDGEALIDYAVSTELLWGRALELALDRNHPAYDTLFVALAERKGLPLLTSDKKLLARFPELALHPEAYLERSG